MASDGERERSKGWVFYDQYLIAKYIGWPCWMAVAVFAAVFSNLAPRWMPGWAATLIGVSVSISAFVACGVRRARRRRLADNR
jgi:hypothetical protein